jgi:hypothetical protein
MKYPLYADDVLFFGDNYEELWSDIREYYSEAREIAIPLESNKVIYFQHEIRFLGQIIRSQSRQTRRIRRRRGRKQ